MTARFVIGALILLLAMQACLSSASSPDSRLIEDSQPILCNKDKSSAYHEQNTPQYGGHVSIRILREPASLLSLIDDDPIIKAIIDHSVLETLIRVSEDSTTFEPELAEKFELNLSKNQYIFHLNPEATWHDGPPVTATDVKFVFSKLIDPFSSLPLAKFFADVSDIDTPDQDTVIFTLSRQTPGFLNAVAQIPILPSHIFGRIPLSVHGALRAPIGSGPFRFVRWIPSQLIELERNPHWRGRAPYVDEIKYFIVPENRIALDLYQSGKIDIIIDDSFVFVPSKVNAQTVSFATPFMETWLFNSKTEIFRDERLRRAVAMLIDKATILTSALNCSGDLPDSDRISSRTDGFLFRTLPFDPQSAGRLLDGIGWRGRDRNGIRVKNGERLAFSLMLSNIGRDSERAVNIIQEDLARAGIEMKIAVVSRGAFLARLETGNFDSAVIPVSINSTDSVALFFHSEQGQAKQLGGLGSEELDMLISKLHTEFSMERQNELRKEIATQINNMLPSFFLYRSHNYAIIRPDVFGIYTREGFFDVTKFFRLREDKLYFARESQ